MAGKSNQGEGEGQSPASKKWIVAIDFYSNDKVRVKYEREQDVSHLSKDRLEKLEAKGVVKSI